MTIILMVIFFFLINFLINIFAVIFSNMQLILKNETVHIDYGSLIYTFPYNYWVYIALAVIIFLIVGIKFFVRMKVSFHDYNVGQHGTERFLTFKEIKEQYKEIPEAGESFLGRGGIPVCRYQDKIYIDDDLVNSLIVGTTRSGKGVDFVFPIIDIFSRAQEKASMVIFDPKGEMAAASFHTLEKRGYAPYILNFSNPNYSMGYNPLTQIIKAYKNKDYGTAELLAKNYANSIYTPNNSGEGSDKFFSLSSSAALVAAILAHTDDCLKADEQINSEVKRKLEDEALKQQKKKLSPKAAQYTEQVYLLRDLSYEQENIDIPYIKELLNLTESETQNLEYIIRIYALQKDLYQKEEDGLIEFEDETEYFGYISKKLKISPEQVKQYILSGEQGFISFLSNIPKFRETLAFLNHIPFKPTARNEKKITMYSIVNMFSELAAINIDDRTTALDVYFCERPPFDRAKRKYFGVKVAGDETKGSVFATVLSELELFTYDEVARMTAESSIDLLDVGFGDKPIAIFLVVPDYDTSLYPLVTIFISQLYFILAKAASDRNGKCKRQVVFLLDEVGNLPPIDNLSQILTVCLGRNLMFILFVQALQQIENLYGQNHKTITGNCGNKVYLHTGDPDTAKRFSEEVGNKTIKVVTRHGERFSRQKSFTESWEKRPLIDENELMDLHVDQCVVVRKMHREDLNGGNITTFPIYNHGKYRMKPHYLYLKEEFPNNLTIETLPWDNNINSQESPSPTLKARSFIDPQARSLSAEKYLKERQERINQNLLICDLLIIKKGTKKEVVDMIANFMGTLSNILGIPDDTLENMKVHEVLALATAKHQNHNISENEFLKVKQIINQLLKLKEGENK